MEMDTDDGQPSQHASSSLMTVLFTLGSRWIVYNEPSDVLQERDIKYYTESASRSGGGAVSSIETLDDYNYVVHFQNHKDAVNVVRRKTHTVKGWSLSAFLFDTHNRSVYSGHQYIAWQGSRANRDHKENIKSVDSNARRTVLVTGHFCDTLTSDRILALLQNLGRERCPTDSIQFVEPASLAFVQFQLPSDAQTVASMVQKDVEATRFHLFLYRGVYMAELADVPFYTTDLLGAPGSPVTLRGRRTTEHKSPDTSCVTRATVSATSATSSLTSATSTITSAMSTVTPPATSSVTFAASSRLVADTQRTESQQEAPFEVTMRTDRPSGRLSTSRSKRSPLSRGIDFHEPLKPAEADGDLCLLQIKADESKAVVNETARPADSTEAESTEAQAILDQPYPQTESAAYTKDQVEAMIKNAFSCREAHQHSAAAQSPPKLIADLNRFQEQTRSSYNLKQNQMKAQISKLTSTVDQLRSEVSHLKAELQSQRRECQELKSSLEVKDNMNSKLNAKTREAIVEHTTEEITAMRAEFQKFRNEIAELHDLFQRQTFHAVQTCERGSFLFVVNPSDSSSDSQRSSNMSTT